VCVCVCDWPYPMWIYSHDSWQKGCCSTYTDSPVTVADINTSQTQSNANYTFSRHPPVGFVSLVSIHLRWPTREAAPHYHHQQHLLLPSRWTTMHRYHILSHQWKSHLSLVYSVSSHKQTMTSFMFLTHWKLEIHSGEREICPTAKSTIKSYN